MLSFVFEVIEIGRHLARVTDNFVSVERFDSTDSACVALPDRGSLYLPNMMILFACFRNFRHELDHVLVVLRLFLSDSR